MQLTRYRSAAIALVTATCFSLTSTATAVARPLEPVGLPAPTPLVLHPSESRPGEAPVAPGEAPVAPGLQPAAAPIDVPIRVPAQTKVTLGKFILVLLAIVGLIVLAAIGVIVYALWDIRTNNE
jgi:hypothetical protein